jgi:DNA-binding NarL/FixJ family response regulator
MSRFRVLLADDHTMFLDALTKLLEPQFDVVGTAEDGRVLIRKAAELLPDVAVVDICMPLLNGMDAAEQLKRVSPKTKVLFLTQNQDPSYAAEAFRRNASGYLVKNSAATELITAIQAAMRGGTHVSPLITEDLLTLIADSARRPIDPVLTARQKEIVQLLAEGKSMREVSEILHITVRTVEFHKKRIMVSLGLKNNADLVRYAVSRGIVGP